MIVLTLDALPPTTVRQLERVLRGVPAGFAAWNSRVSPRWRWDWPHLAYVQRQMDRVTDGEIDRLILAMPPRHGKSETVTVRYPVYRLVEWPEFRTIVAAYNATLAAKFSRKARRLACLAGVSLSEERTAVEDWETTAGGGVRAVGVGGGVTGHGADLIVIDDPVKSREEAESPTYRDRVWDWFRDDLYTRLEPGGAIVLILTRWHQDDLAGRILEQEPDRWEVVRLPARAEPDDPLGRPTGAALCPDRYDEEALAAIEQVLGPYSWSALYQQDPHPRSGNLFPRDRALIVDAVPAHARHVRYWDKAGTAGGGNRTAGVRMAVADGVYYVVDVVLAQLASAERNRLMRQTAELDGPSVRGWVEQEPGSGGKESAEATLRLLSGFPYRAETVTGDKVTRADPFAAQWQAGNVRIVRGPWNRAYLDELEAFPAGKYDDQVDASSGAFAKLALGGRLRVY